METVSKPESRRWSAWSEEGDVEVPASVHVIDESEPGGVWMGSAPVGVHRQVTPEVWDETLAGMGWLRVSPWLRSIGRAWRCWVEPNE